MNPGRLVTLIALSTIPLAVAVGTVDFLDLVSDRDSLWRTVPGPTKIFACFLGYAVLGVSLAASPKRPTQP